MGVPGPNRFPGQGVEIGGDELMQKHANATIGFASGALVGGFVGLMGLVYSRSGGIWLSDLVEEAILGGVAGAIIAWRYGIGRRGNAMDQFRKSRLAQPLRFRPGLLMYLFVLGGGGFLMISSLLTLEHGDPIERIYGLFGLVFLGAAFPMFAGIAVRSGRRGLVELSERGIYLAHLDLQIPWSDIGPAWVTRLRSGITVGKDVFFIVRNFDTHKGQLGPIRRRLWEWNEKALRSKSGMVDWALKGFAYLADQEEVGESAIAQLEELRRRLGQEPGASALNIPSILRFGLSSENAAEIINTEVLRRSGA